MRYLLFILIILIFTACDSAESNKCKDVVCNNWESCSEKNGLCEIKEGMCNSNFECESEYCNNHICEELLCNEWEFANNGICMLKEDKCNSTVDCSNKICNTTTHDCIIYPCINQNCSGKGTCSVSSDFTAVCNCNEGYEAQGLSCIKNDVDLCEDINCSYWQECNSENGQCETKEGKCETSNDCFGMQICDENHDCVDSDNPCENQTCSNHGECVVENNSAKCNCETDYHPVGLTCITDVTDLCTNVSCEEWEECNLSNGACVLKAGRCDSDTDCLTDYICDSSNFCLNPNNPCENQTCSNHGVCADTTGVPICTCDEGYSLANQGRECNNNCGDTILVDDEDCEGNLNGQTCQTLGYSAGNLTCEECLFNRTDCRLTKQWGSNDSDEGKSVAVDNSGNVFVTGNVRDDLDGNTNVGENDIFLTKFDNEGNKLWSKQWGTTENDKGNSVAIDGSGNVFVTGYTEDGLDENTNAGGVDVFLNKFDNEGNKLWTKQWGTIGEDKGNSVAVDNSGNVFVIGSTFGDLDGNINNGGFDMFLTKFDNDGIKLWTKQWGSISWDNAFSVAVDSSGNVFITGMTTESLDGNTFIGIADIFLTKFDNEGNKLLTKQWGTATEDQGLSVAVDNLGNVFVTGYTGDQWDGDVFLTKFDNNGNKLWNEEWGTSFWEKGNSVIVDNERNILIAGYTGGSLDGNTTTNDTDIFLTKFDNEGNKLWVKQWGTGIDSESQGFSVAVDNSGNVFITGYIYNELDGNINTNTDCSFFECKDIFLTKFDAE